MLPSRVDHSQQRRPLRSATSAWRTGRRWRSAKSLPGDFLVNHDLITVFHVGWTVLHKDVGMYAAERLQEVLAGLRCDDCNVHTGLDALRIELSTCCRAGMP